MLYQGGDDSGARAGSGQTPPESSRNILAPWCRGESNQNGRAPLHEPVRVKFHVSNILMKLGATSRTEAVAIALQKGLVL